MVGPKLNKTMKVLVYGLNFTPRSGLQGGIRTKCALWLASRGHRVKVITGYPSLSGLEDSAALQQQALWTEQRDGVRDHPLPALHPFQPDLEGAPRPLLLVRDVERPSCNLACAQISARTWCSRSRRSLLVAPCSRSGGAADRRALVAAHPGPSRSRLRSSSASPRATDCAAARSLSSARCSQRFDRVSTISAKMIDRLVSKRVPRARTVEFRNWVDTSLIKPQDRVGSFRSDLGLAPETIVALYSGGMALKQGLGTLVDAARLLENSGPRSPWCSAATAPPATI